MNHRCLTIALVCLLLGAQGIAMAATQSPHETLKWDCQDCHTAESWSTISDKPVFKHKDTGYELLGAHAKADCRSCHTDLKFDKVKTDCVDCHSDPHQGQLSSNCQNCHSPRDWKLQDDVLSKHADRGFPLTGVHAATDCDACHGSEEPRTFVGTPTDCAECHMADYRKPTNPDHTAAGFGLDCQVCHTNGSVSWTDATYEHPASFPLTGAHAGPSCVDCHADQYAGTRTECIACHEADFHATTDPDHVAGNFDENCAQCHTTTAWSPADFDHNLADFKLTGAHVQTACDQCHTSGYANTPMDCYACHEQDFVQAPDPDHVDAGFDHKCETCHTTDAWANATIDHNLTDFPLTGAHVSVDCNECHENGYTGTATECYACHSTSFAATTDPNHAANDFDHDCRACHTTEAWSPASFDHDQTDFPLTGAHADATCISCHAEGYTGTSMECYACHENDFQLASDPNHVDGNFDHNCATCHTTAGWSPATFDHDLADFKLTGAHVAVDCDQCHASGYTGTPMECFACHETDYAGVADPNHVSGNYDHDCTACHTTAAWTPAEFDHALTNFPLTGAHATVTCESCHASQFTGTSMECVACHEADYLAVVDPDHVSAGFPKQCATCHNTTAWRPSEIDHDLTGFPLTGAHAGVLCETCHPSGYTGTDPACFACHDADYTNVSDPDHAGGNYDHDCAICHTTSAWTPAEFDHNALTDFALTGAHASTTCESCHSSGYTGTSLDCFVCHEADYMAATDPEHSQAGYPHQCEMCHTSDGWQPADFDHATTQFPLVGAHASVNCQSCHATGFAGTPTDCYSCHETDYANAPDPNHVAGGYDHDCTTCHTLDAWTPATIDHNLTNFPLTGAHTAVTCNSCHTSGFTGTTTECDGCHHEDFLSAADPDHQAAGFLPQCEVCHTTDAWQPANLDHDLTGFPLTGAHTAVACNTCHADGYSGTPTACYDCHETDYASTDEPDHVLANFDHDCTTCHNTSAWTPADWDHNQTAFPLTGAHVTVTCNTCHTTGYASTPTACFACHENDFTTTVDPNHTEAGFPTTCQTCHNTTAWAPADIDHNLTGFPLTGAHQAVACENCHASGYTGTPTDCYSCHDGDFTSAADPNHVEAGFPTTCQTCHNTVAWQPATLDHDLTGFPLTGAHQAVACVDCHAAGYTGTPSACYDCHASDYAGTNDPDHALAGFDHDCTQCHTTGSWDNADWSHDQTGFSLTGAHVAVTCNSCHATTFAGTASDCDGCHHGDFVATVDPNHVDAGFLPQCETCHNTSAWQPATFDHDQSGFPLTGAHLAIACNQCHATGYTGTPTDCFSCHESDYAATEEPDHALGNFDHDCTTCHTTNGWDPSTWSHNQTNFPLTGAHAGTNCSSCHASGFAGTPMECVACHENDFTSAADPDHVSAGFPSTCTLCHSSASWRPATLDHNLTGFPLTGAHTSVACAQCHSSGYTGTPSDCYSCHQSDFASVSDPDHVGGGFNHDCTNCHTTVAWTPADIDHSQTSFPLTGAHLAVACNVCHTTGFTGTPTDCYSCHQTDFASTSDPDHVGGGYSHDCTVCHSTTGWQPADINHDLTGFPLTGAHLSATCIQCHSSGYTGTPTLCFACHESDYNTTSDPNHAAANFPTDCQACHTTNGWQPANWDHDSQFFPIYSGSHRGRWSSCQDCHLVTTDFSAFECIYCHAHDQSTTDGHHREVGRYVYESAACYDCHPTGRAGD